ncbi:hypothetical protein ACS0TY_021826 [Phlomoides rotata]
MEFFIWGSSTSLLPNLVYFEGQSVAFGQSQASMPLRKRSTIRRLARELGVSKNTVWRWIKEGLITPHTNAIKPELTA